MLDLEIFSGMFFCCGSSRVLSSSSISLEVSLSFRHGEGDEEGRGGGAADEEGHAPRDEGDEGDEGHEVSWRGVIGAWAWLRRVVVSTSLLSVGQKMQLNLCR